MIRLPRLFSFFEENSHAARLYINIYNSFKCRKGVGETSGPECRQVCICLGRKREGGWREGGGGGGKQELPVHIVCSVWKAGILRMFADIHRQTDIPYRHAVCLFYVFFALIEV